MPPQPPTNQHPVLEGPDYIPSQISPRQSEVLNPDIMDTTLPIDLQDMKAEYEERPVQSLSLLKTIVRELSEPMQVAESSEPMQVAEPSEPIQITKTSKPMQEPLQESCGPAQVQESSG